MPYLARRLLPLALLAACVGSTGNERVAFTASVGGVERDARAPLSFTNDFGWEVTLDRATLTLGPVYLNTIRPLREARRSWLIGQAWAHEDHLDSGLIVGQVLGQISADLLSPSLVPFAEPGVVTRDPVRTAEVFFYPPPGLPPETVKIPTAALDIAGSARQGEQSVKFRGKLVLDDDWLPKIAPGERGYTPINAIREVRGIPAGFTPEEGGRLEIRVDAAALLRNANFSQIVSNPRATDDPSTVLLRQGTEGADQVMKALYNGLQSSFGTYSVRWVRLRSFYLKTVHKNQGDRPCPG